MFYLKLKDLITEKSRLDLFNNIIIIYNNQDTIYFKIIFYSQNPILRIKHLLTIKWLLGQVKLKLLKYNKSTITETLKNDTLYLTKLTLTQFNNDDKYILNNIISLIKHNKNKITISTSDIHDLQIEMDKFFNPHWFNLAKFITFFINKYSSSWEGLELYKNNNNLLIFNSNIYYDKIILILEEYSDIQDFFNFCEMTKNFKFSNKQINRLKKKFYKLCYFPVKFKLTPKTIKNNFY